MHGPVKNILSQQLSISSQKSINSKLTEFHVLAAHNRTYSYIQDINDT